MAVLEAAKCEADDGRWRESDPLGHRPRTPVRGIVGFGFPRPSDDFFDLDVGDGPRCAEPRLIDQAFQAIVQKSLSPFADGGKCDLQFFGDVGIGRALGGRQADAGSEGDSLSRFGLANPSVQFCRSSSIVVSCLTALSAIT